jgi:YD repeat-containing protein
MLSQTQVIGLDDLTSGETDDLTTFYVYNDAGDLLETIDPRGNSTRQTYNQYGQPLTGTDPLGNTTRNQFDHRGLLRGITDPLGNTVRMDYDVGQPDGRPQRGGPDAGQQRVQRVRRGDRHGAGGGPHDAFRLYTSRAIRPRVVLRQLGRLAGPGPEAEPVRRQRPGGRQPRGSSCPRASSSPKTWPTR